MASTCPRICSSSRGSGRPPPAPPAYVVRAQCAAPSTALAFSAPSVTSADLLRRHLGLLQRSRLPRERARSDRRSLVRARLLGERESQTHAGFRGTSRSLVTSARTKTPPADLVVADDLDLLGQISGRGRYARVAAQRTRGSTMRRERSRPPGPHDRATTVPAPPFSTASERTRRYRPQDPADVDEPTGGGRWPRCRFAPRRSTDFAAIARPGTRARFEQSTILPGRIVEHAICCRDLELHLIFRQPGLGNGSVDSWAMGAPVVPGAEHSPGPVRRLRREGEREGGARGPGTIPRWPGFLRAPRGTRARPARAGRCYLGSAGAERAARPSQQLRGDHATARGRGRSRLQPRGLRPCEGARRRKRAPCLGAAQRADDVGAVGQEAVSPEPRGAGADPRPSTPSAAP